MSNSTYTAKHRIGYVRLPGSEPNPEDGWMRGPNYVQQNPGPLQADIKNCPLPICPECKDTKFVENTYKGPYPPFLQCSKCQVEWNGAGKVFPLGGVA